MHGDVCLGLSDSIWCQIMIDFPMSCNLLAARRIQWEWDPRPPADEAHGLQIGSWRRPFCMAIFLYGRAIFILHKFRRVHPYIFDPPNACCGYRYRNGQETVKSQRAAVLRILFVFAQWQMSCMKQMHARTWFGLRHRRRRRRCCRRRRRRRRCQKAPTGD